MTTPDPYAVLGVGRRAPAEEIRRAYLALARRHHPDHGGDAAVMQAVNGAWAVLGDPARRRAWDAEHDEHGRARVWVAAPSSPSSPSAASGAWAPGGVDPDDLADLLDDRPFAPPRRSLVDLVPAALFAAAVATGCLALALDEPGLLAAAGFLFFLSCVAVGAVALLSMRRSVRAGRR